MSCQLELITEMFKHFCENEQRPSANNTVTVFQPSNEDDIQSLSRKLSYSTISDGSNFANLDEVELHSDECDEASDCYSVIDEIYLTRSSEQFTADISNSDPDEIFLTQSYNSNPDPADFPDSASDSSDTSDLPAESNERNFSD